MLREVPVQAVVVAIASGGCTKGVGVGVARCCKWCVQGQDMEHDVSAGYSVLVNTRYVLSFSQYRIQCVSNTGYLVSVNQHMTHGAR